MKVWSRNILGVKWQSISGSWYCAFLLLAKNMQQFVVRKGSPKLVWCCLCKNEAGFRVECVTPGYLCLCTFLSYFFSPYFSGKHSSRCLITYTYFLIIEVCSTSRPLPLPFFLPHSCFLSHSLSSPTPSVPPFLSC